MNKTLLAVAISILSLSLYATEKSLIDSVTKIKYDEDRGDVNDELTTYEYHEDGAVKEEIKSVWSGYYNDWVKKTRIVYSSEHNPLLDSKITFHWDKAISDWVFDEIEKTEYDSEGRIVLELDSTSTRLQCLVENIYENGKLIEQKEANWNLTKNKKWEYDEQRRLLRFTNTIIINNVLYQVNKKRLLEEKIHSYTDTIEEVIVKHWFYVNDDSIVDFEYNLKNTYNSNNQLIEKEGRVNDSYVKSGEFSEETKELYTYGDNGQLTEKLILKQLANSDEWEVVRKISNLYYDNGNLKDSVVYKLNQNTKEFEYLGELSLYENGNSKKQVTIASDFDSQSIDFYLYLNLDPSYLEYNWFPELWLSDTLSYGWAHMDYERDWYSRLDSVVYEWDEDGNETLFENYYEEGTQEWIGENKFEIKTIPNDEYIITEKINYAWDAENKKWYPRMKLHTKQKEGYKEQNLFKWDTENEMWIEFNSDVILEKEDVVERYDYEWDGKAEEWVYSSREVEEYDDDGNMIRFSNDNWNPETEEWEIADKYNYVYSYKNDEPIVSLQNSSFDIKVFPSVFSSELKIESENVLNDYKISLINSNGVIEYLSTKNGIVHTSDLSEGVYFIIIEGQGVKRSFCVKKQ